jgi:hypothetical protein
MACHGEEAMPVNAVVEMDARLLARARAKAVEMGVSLDEFVESSVEEYLERTEQRIVLSVSLAVGEPLSEAELIEKQRRISDGDDLKSLGNPTPDLLG